MVWHATFATNVNLGRYCGFAETLISEHHILATRLGNHRYGYEIHPVHAEMFYWILLRFPKKQNLKDKIQVSKDKSGYHSDY